jgi:hypothetical protein
MAAANTRYFWSADLSHIAQKAGEQLGARADAEPPIDFRGVFENGVNAQVEMVGYLFG